MKENRLVQDGSTYRNIHLAKKGRRFETLFPGDDNLPA
jgi:hypothetical protein